MLLRPSPLVVIIITVHTKQGSWWWPGGSAHAACGVAGWYCRVVVCRDGRGERGCMFVLGVLPLMFALGVLPLMLMLFF